jgi:glycosyltransferase involved in cell wall biosynthesis
MSDRSPPRQIAIDLTPLRPVGENGGAKILVLTLLQQLPILAPDWRFLWLTAAWNHAELAAYETTNSQRRIVVGAATPTSLPASWAKLRRKLRREPAPHCLADQAIDLLFCPFSAPTYAQAGRPTVAIVYDLQHVDYPHFFSPAERQQRTKFITDLTQIAQKIICISHFSQRSLIHHFNVSSDQTVVIPIAVHDRWQSDHWQSDHWQSIQFNRERLATWGLGDRPYAFYPANFWPHKNHAWLLEVYRLYRQRVGDRALDLVFTGSLEPAARQLRQTVAALNLQPYVHFLGFLAEADLAAVWAGCYCLVFPSLYEGFGIPLLEAMVFGKPVLSSLAGSLPEVGQAAARYFDPHQPEELIAHLIAITQHPALVDELVTKGRQRLLQVGDAMAMTQAYLQVFTTVLQSREN